MRKFTILLLCILGITMITYGVIDTNNISRCTERLGQMKTKLQKELEKTNNDSAIVSSFEVEKGNLKLEVYSVPDENIKESYSLQENRKTNDFSLMESFTNYPKNRNNWAFTAPGSFLIYSTLAIVAIGGMLLYRKRKKYIAIEEKEEINEENAA